MQAIPTSVVGVPVDFTTPFARVSILDTVEDISCGITEVTAECRYEVVVELTDTESEKKI